MKRDAIEAAATIEKTDEPGPLAQLAEQRAFNPRLSPVVSTLESLVPVYPGLFELETLEPPRCPGVYAIAGLPGYIKIGRAQDIAERIDSLRSGHPAPLRLLAVLSFDPEQERPLHGRWAHLRTHGEWFIESAALRAFVLERRTSPESAPPADAPIPLARFDVFRAADAYRVCGRQMNVFCGIPRARDVSAEADYQIENHGRKRRQPLTSGLEVTYVAGAACVKLEPALAVAYVQSLVRTRHRPKRWMQAEREAAEWWERYAE